MRYFWAAQFGQTSVLLDRVRALSLGEVEKNIRFGKLTAKSARSQQKLRGCIQGFLEDHFESGAPRPSHLGLCTIELKVDEQGFVSGGGGLD